MPKNNRQITSVTRSISFKRDVFAVLEIRRKALRLERSTYIGYILEDRLGIVKRPFLG